MICAMGFVCSCNGGLDGSKQKDTSVHNTRRFDWEVLYRCSEGTVEQVLKANVLGDEMWFKYVVVANSDSLCYALSGGGCILHFFGLRYMLKVLMMIDFILKNMMLIRNI